MAKVIKFPNFIQAEEKAQLNYILDLVASFEQDTPVINLEGLAKVFSFIEGALEAPVEDLGEALKGNCVIKATNPEIYFSLQVLLCSIGNKVLKLSEQLEEIETYSKIVDNM